jgi:hypothetical protein
MNNERAFCTEHIRNRGVKKINFKPANNGKESPPSKIANITELPRQTFGPKGYMKWLDAEWDQSMKNYWNGDNKNQ